MPEGTELLVSLEHPGVRGLDGLLAQDKPFVQPTGYFSTRCLASRRGIGPGRYRANIVAPLAHTQSAAVQAIIGDRGQNLRGPLARRDDVGLGKFVEVNKLFVIGGAGGVKQQARARKAEAARYRKVHRRLTALGKKLAAASRARWGDARWIPFAQDFQRKVAALRAEVESAPVGSAGGFMRGAAVNLSTMLIHSPGKPGGNRDPELFAEMQRQFRDFMRDAAKAMR
jgi:hypothetical protein